MKPSILFLNVIIALCLLGIVAVEDPLFRYAAVFLIALSTFLNYTQFRKRADLKESVSHSGNITDIDIQDISEELTQLFEILESAVNEDLLVVKQELRQIKGLVNNASNELSESFYSLSSSCEKQTNLINSLRDSLYSTNNKKLLRELDNIQSSIKKDKADAIRSLQFEDIVTQVSDNSIQYLENLDQFLTEFKKRLTFSINNPHQSSNVSSQMKNYVEDVKIIRQKKSLPDRKAAHQKTLDEGGIELF